MNFDYTKSPAENRSLLLPRKLHRKELVLKMERLLRRLGERVGKAFDDPFEERLHELSHHVTLSGLVFKKRKISISAAIGEMGSVTQDGNEIDTIALQLETSWWLHYPLSLKAPINLQEDRSALHVFTVRQAREAVAATRRDWSYNEALELAQTIYSQRTP